MNIRQLSNQLKIKAECEIGENEEVAQEYLNEIKEWLDNQPHIIARTDDQWLITFLRGTKFNLEKAKQKIEYFYTSRTALPELFRNRDPFLPELQQLLNLGVLVPLPIANANGERLILVRLGLPELTNIAAEHIFKYYTCIVDILLQEDDNFIVGGVQAIIDMKNSTINHYSQYWRHPILVKKLISCMLRANPIRPKGLYFINAPSVFALFYGFFSPFIPRKLKTRTAVLSHQNLVIDSINTKLLPQEYGGDIGSIKDIQAKWKTKVESYQNWYLSEEKFYVDENKRSIAPSSNPLNWITLFR